MGAAGTNCLERRNPERSREREREEDDEIAGRGVEEEGMERWMEAEGGKL